MQSEMMITNCKRPQWTFYLGWIGLSALSLLLALGIYMVLITPTVKILGDKIMVGGVSHITEDFLVPYMLWPALGLANGLLQYLLLRRYLPRMGWWIAATAIGWIVGLFSTRYLFLAGGDTPLGVNSIAFGVARVVLTGGAIGLAQWFVLRQRVRQAAWWILANLLGWGVSALFARWLYTWVLVAPAIITMIALWLLLDWLPRHAEAAS